MTKVCLIGKDDYDLTETLLEHETSKEALQSYQLEHPWENTLAVDTISLGAAVALLNDLKWYLTRYTDGAWIQEPSVSASEWLSRALAKAIRDERLDPGTTDEFYQLYGIEDNHLTEPIFVRRRNESLPEYDLEPVDETVAVRITESEFRAD